MLSFFCLVLMQQQQEEPFRFSPSRKRSTCFRRSADVPDNVVICDLWTLNGVPFIRLDRFRSEKPKVIKLVFAQAIGLSG
jgi:hypothetical protein